VHDWLAQVAPVPYLHENGDELDDLALPDANGLMPGMATTDQIARLGQATVLYSQLMIRHHLGGVMVVDGVLARSDRGDVLALAGPMKRVQQNEITVFSAVLARNGAASFDQTAPAPATMLCM